MPVPYLLWARAMLFGCMWFAMSAVEPVFDAIDAELERQEVDL